MKAAAYDWFYRIWAPWDGVGVRSDLIDLLAGGDVDTARYPRALDLGCGTGANVVHLAEIGFESYGVDFSSVAIDKASNRARVAGVDATFVEADLTATRSLVSTAGSTSSSTSALSTTSKEQPARRWRRL